MTKCTATPQLTYIKSSQVYCSHVVRWPNSKNTQRYTDYGIETWVWRAYIPVATSTLTKKAIIADNSITVIKAACVQWRSVRLAQRHSEMSPLLLLSSKLKFWTMRSLTFYDRVMPSRNNILTFAQCYYLNILNSIPSVTWTCWCRCYWIVWLVHSVVSGDVTFHRIYQIRCAVCRILLTLTLS